MLMAIDTFAASAALPSMYFLLLPQKKVPKKRGATSKRLPYTARPHGPASGRRRAQAPEAAALRVHPCPPCFFGRAQPHVSSFHLRYCLLRMRFSELWPILKPHRLTIMSALSTKPQKYTNQGAMFSGKTQNRP